MARITKALYSAKGEIALFYFDNNEVQGMSTAPTFSEDDRLTPETIRADIDSGKLPGFLSMFPGDPDELTNKTIAENDDWETVYEAA